MKEPDPIIEEIHAIREALANAQGNELEKIAKAAREAGDKRGRRLVTRPPRRVPSTQTAS